MQKYVKAYNVVSAAEHRSFGKLEFKQVLREMNFHRARGGKQNPSPTAPPISLLREI